MIHFVCFATVFFSLSVAATEARFTEVMKHYVYQITIQAKYKLTFLCFSIITLSFWIVKISGANYRKKFPVVFFHEEGGENELSKDERFSAIALENSNINSVFVLIILVYLFHVSSKSNVET